MKNLAEEVDQIKNDLALLIRDWLGTRSLPHLVNPDPYSGLYRWKLSTPDFRQITSFGLPATAGIREIWESPEPERRARFFDLLETELLPLLSRGPVLECYFDGANKATEEFDRVVLAIACGSPEQWRDLEADWKALRERHSAPPLHTTDAAALGGKFCRKYGWNERRVDDYIIDAVKVIRRYLESGLHVATLTIFLEDYRRARNEIALLPNSVNNILVSESMGFCFRLGRQIGAAKYDLHFDRNEPFRGHVIDVKQSKKALIDVPYFKRVHVCDADVADLKPALQMVDLFAWCISHNDNATRFWHRALNDLSWASRYLDYEYLSKPDMAALERTLGWKLKRRGMEPAEKAPDAYVPLVVISDTAAPEANGFPRLQAQIEPIHSPGGER